MLTFDAAKHEYRWDDQPVPSVTQVIDSHGLYPDYGDDPLYARRGTAVHAVLEALDKGELDVERWLEYDRTRDERWRIEPYYRAYLQFRADAACEWQGIEERVYNTSLRVAGTIDRRGLLNGRHTILDLKATNGIPPAKATAAQTAGYTLLADDSQDTKRFALALHGDTTYKLIEYENPADYAAFAAMARMFHDRKFLEVWKNER